MMPKVGDLIRDLALSDPYIMGPGTVIDIFKDGQALSIIWANEPEVTCEESLEDYGFSWEYWD